MGFLSNKIWVRIFLGHPVLPACSSPARAIVLTYTQPLHCRNGEIADRIRSALADNGTLQVVSLAKAFKQTFLPTRVASTLPNKFLK